MTRLVLPKFSAYLGGYLEGTWRPFTDAAWRRPSHPRRMAGAATRRSTTATLADMVLMQLIRDGNLKPRFTAMAGLGNDGARNQVDPAKRPLAPTRPRRERTNPRSRGCLVGGDLGSRICLGFCLVDSAQDVRLCVVESIECGGPQQGSSQSLADLVLEPRWKMKGKCPRKSYRWAGGDDDDQ
jgi:hypothetical protein